MRNPLKRGPSTAVQVRRLAEIVAQERGNNELLEETITELQLAAEDAGWRRMVAYGQQEFTREGLTQITAICRIMAIKNPLIGRGLNIRQTYVWGQGVEIAARATGNSQRNAGEQDVNTVLQQFLDDPANRRVFSGHQARLQLEQALGTDGNVFLSLWTRPRTGRVQVRTVPWDEITDIICNPDDKSEPWYYRRQWTEERLDFASGTTVPTPRVAFYPALGYRPVSRPAAIGGHPVQWDAPVLHVKVGGQLDWQYGVPDAYSAVDWARAYKDFLEDWARLMKSLARFAWRTTAPARNAAKVKSRLADPPSRDPATGQPNQAGATAITSPNVTLEAIPKTGATLDSESGRPLAAMVAAGLDIPVTMLLGDPGMTGARATAETLDRPTELAMGSRRELWADVIRQVCEYVILESARAVDGELRGVVGRDEYGRETVALAGDTDVTIDVVWPPLEDTDVESAVKAIVQANTTGVMPPLQIARLLLQALGVTDVDEILDQLTDENGQFLYPDSPGAGQAAVDAFRHGRDPAALLSGDQQAGGGGSGDQPGDAASGGPAAGPSG